MKAYKVADLLYAQGWRAPCDAQYDFLTKIVTGDELLEAIFADRKEIAMEAIVEKYAEPIDDAAI